MDEIFLRLEAKRKEAVHYSSVNGILLALSIIGFIIIRVAAGSHGSRSGIGVTIVFVLTALLALATLIMFFAFTSKKINDYKNSFKREVVEGILKNSFTDLTFNPDEKIPQSTIEATGMMMLGNRYSGNDYVRGKYKDIRFEQSDLCIQQVTHSGKHTHTTTYFKGRWMVFDFNKNFVSDLLVKEHDFTYADTNSSWFTAKSERMAKLELEDTAFNNEFDVYMLNQEEAYYILTPHFMESIRKLNNMVEGSLILCFSATRLHVGVYNNKDAFEPSLYAPLDKSVVDSIYQDIAVITGFVDELKLDRTLYKNSTETI